MLIFLGMEEKYSCWPPERCPSLLQTLAEALQCCRPPQKEDNSRYSLVSLHHPAVRDIRDLKSKSKGNHFTGDSRILTGVPSFVQGYQLNDMIRYILSNKYSVTFGGNIASRL
jgi:hypothetical protein